MRIAVVGAGAMGSIIGAGVAEAGHDTVLVDVAAPLVERLNADGVTVQNKAGEERTVRVPATTDPGSVGPVDLAVVFVKCYHTDAAASAAAPLVGDGTVIASLQNGWGNEEILARHFGADRVVAGVTYNSGTVLELGKVAHTGVGPTLVGPFEGTSLDGARRVEEALTSAGFEVTVTGGIRTEIWKKLILNAATLPQAALTGLRIAPLGTPGPMRDLVDEAAREATAVAQAAGYEIDPAERIETIHGLLSRGGDGKASMLQDFEAVRRSEVDVITGAVLREAGRHGIGVPVNRALFALVQGWERAHGLGE
ncbi:MAG: 2-dehydropantoate 2-reductase [Thermoleophilia bacterium]|nr:2-dehydropantoate 2-reductase [Thermoleophilia bacterium]